MQHLAFFYAKISNFFKFIAQNATYAVFIINN